MSTFVDNLRQDILSSRIKERKLEDDLRNLNKVYAIGAHEAVVFYSARILEAIMKDAHRLFFGEASYAGAKEPTLAEIETDLFDYNLLVQSRYYWARGLRLLGNEVRHSLRRITSEEADCALIFLEFILTWYFCEFPLKQRQTTIFKGASPQRSAANLLLDLAWTLDRSRLDPKKLQVVFGPRLPDYLDSFSRNFTFPLLLIEIFIAQEEGHDSASRLVEALDASAFQPKKALKDRFTQLKGLLLSREGKLEEALLVLEADYARQKNGRQTWVDNETVGILAGVYKRFWKKGGEELYLSKSHETYCFGWQRNSNPYLGINAATTALLLNKPLDAKSIASKVKALLERRRKMVQEKTAARYDLNYWDLVTLAEANLLLRNLETSAGLYQQAFSDYQLQPDNIAVTKKQIALLAEQLKLSDAESAALLAL